MFGGCYFVSNIRWWLSPLHSTDKLAAFHYISFLLHIYTVLDIVKKNSDHIFVSLYKL